MLNFIHPFASFDYFPNQSSFITDPAALALCHTDFSDLEKFVGLKGALLLASDHEWFHNHCCNKTGIPVVKCALLQSYDNWLSICNPFETGKGYVPIKDVLVGVINSPYSHYRNCHNPPMFLTLMQIYNLIKGKGHAPATSILRAFNYNSFRDTYREYNFHVANLAGVYISPDDFDSIKPTGLICMNLDQIGDRLSEYRCLINACKDTIMSFKSVDGDGLRVIFKALPYPGFYQDYYNYYSNLLRDVCGLTLQNNFNYPSISQYCYLPHDPEVFLNLNKISI